MISSGNWQYKNTYITIVWLLPIFFMFIIGLGSLFYNIGIYGFVIISIAFASITHALRNLFTFTIQMKTIQILSVLNAFVVCVSILDNMTVGSDKQGMIDHPGTGLFMMLFGSLGYFELLRNNNKYELNMNIHYSYHLDFC